VVSTEAEIFSDFLTYTLVVGQVSKNFGFLEIVKIFDCCWRGHDLTAIKLS